MREKVLEIIKRENRNMDAMEIMDLIKKPNTVEDLRNLISLLESMCQDGTLMTNSGNTYKLNDLIIGIVDMHEKGNAHIMVPNSKNDIFISRNNMNRCNNGDTVSVKMIDASRNEGRVVKILDRSIGKNIGEVITVDGKLVVVPVTKDLPFRVEIEDTDINLVDGLLVNLKYVKDLNKGTILAKVDGVICHKNAPDADTRLLANEFSIPIDFPDDVLEEASKMPKELDEQDIKDEMHNGRVDFRDDVIFTIDGKDTKDIDDAIGLKMLQNGNFELAVHIADVSHYVKEGSAIWREAELRGNSNYLGNKVIPMLPIELSNGICSLNPDVDRYTTSCIMEIDRSGKVVGSRIVKGIISSRKKMNYDAVQDIIDNKETEDTKGYETLTYVAAGNDTIDSISYKYNITREELLKYNPNLNVEKGTKVEISCRSIIKNMNVLSKLLKIRKIKRGELEFVNDETKKEFDENDRIIGIHPRIQRDAEKLIEDFMIVANETVATTIFKENLPFVYRVHGVPSPKSIEEYVKFLKLVGVNYTKRINYDNVSNFELQDLLKFLKDKPGYEVYNRKLLRCMQKAIYSSENTGHYGIASPCYTHFTSPIRRFSDLLVHTSLNEYIIKRNTEEKFLKQWESYLSVACEHISDTEKTSKECEYAFDDMLTAEYMEGYVDENGNHVGGHIGEEYDATIDSCLPNSFFVVTPEYIEGRVQLSTLEDYLEYREELMGYVRNNRVMYRFGDKVKVKCIGASKAARTIDFTLVRKK